MDWLKEHAYLATWMSPVLALIIAIVKGKKGEAKAEVREFILYLVLLMSFAIMVTPTFEPVVRGFVGVVFFFLLVFIMFEPHAMG